MTAHSKVLHSELVAATTEIANSFAADHANDVDAQARFPEETFAALKKAGLLSAAVPKAYGGAGAGMLELGTQCAVLSAGCSSSGMILAMHHIQVACIARHAHDSAYFQSYMKDRLVGEQQLIASITSEQGTFGDTRSSVCAVEVDGDTMKLEKDATTVSYGANADSLLVTCRRAAEAAASDQVLVLFPGGQYTLEQKGGWDTLGMRGTCSPGAMFNGHGTPEQIIPGGFADSSAQTMMPYSHILWSALWTGIASAALGRAANFVRASARRKPGSVPPNAPPLARALVELQAMRNNWEACAIEFDQLTAEGGTRARQELDSMRWALKMNQLKMYCSEAAPRLCHQALQIIGILAYKNDTPFSVGRHYRDVLSAALMVSNGRIASKSASMLLVSKDL